METRLDALLAMVDGDICSHFAIACSHTYNLLDVQCRAMGEAAAGCNATENCRIKHSTTSKASRYAVSNAAQAAPLHEALLPLNGVRVLACLWIMVRPSAACSISDASL